MSEQTKRKLKDGAVKGGLGLSGAAIIWIYSTFARASEVDKIRDQLQQTREAVAVLQALTQPVYE